MGLNKQRGNMYEFVTHTWNAIRGRCPHDCKYCYMKAFPLGKISLDKNELQTYLGEGNFIFVGSSCDMFADAIKGQWIKKTLRHCQRYNKNKYLFQSKNPKRMYAMREYIPHGSIVGTTIETNRTYYEIQRSAPLMSERAHFMGLLQGFKGFKTMVTIEPIMDFDLEALMRLIIKCKPEWVNIGADSKGHKLPEPSREKIEQLIVELAKHGIKIEKKRNLDRLLK